MKTILLISALVVSAFTTTQAQAQPWATAGATWHYSVQGLAMEGYTQLTNSKDTIIGGKLCNALQPHTERYDFTTQTYTTVDGGYYYTYTDSNKVYYYVNNHFSLLYNFNAIAGTSWFTEFDTTQNSVQNCSQYLDTVMVDSVKIELINSVSLRKLYVHVTRNNYTYNDQIIEKIGSLNYLFPIAGTCNVIVESGSGPLRCYTDSSGLYFQQNPSSWGGGACDFVTTTREQNKAVDHITTFPNPTSTTLTINTTANISTVRMYNALGQQVINNVYTTASNTQTIPVNTLPNGIYMLQVSTVNNTISTTKIIVQE
jgi:hypothetical protein